MALLKTIQTILFATLFSWTLNAYSADLRPFEAHYEVSYGPLSLGEGVMLLKKNGSSWQLTFDAEPDGMLSWFVSSSLHEKSYMQRTHDGKLRSKRYQFEVRGDKSQHHTVLFSYLTDTIRRVDGKKKWRLPDEVAADKLNFPLVIAHHLLNDEPLPSPMRIAGHHYVWKVNFKKIGEEVLERNGTTYEVVHFHSSHKKDKIDIWFDVSRHYLPIEVNFYSGSGWTSKYHLLRHKWLDS